jgi:hypothetical protein
VSAKPSEIWHRRPAQISWRTFSKMVIDEILSLLLGAVALGAWRV